MSRQTFSKNTVIYLIGGIVSAGGNILIAPVYLRLLSAEDYGVWSKFNLFLQFLQPIMSWGLLATMTRLLVESEAEARSQKLAAALKLVTGLNFGLLILIIWMTQQELIKSVKLLYLLPFAATVASLVAYPSILMGVYVADGKAFQYRSLSLFGFILQGISLTIFSKLFFFDAKMAIIALIVSAGGYAALSIYKLAKAAKWDSHSYDYKELFAFGAPLTLYVLAGQATDFITKYALAGSTSSIEFGIFSAGILYASLTAMLASAINLSWTPIYYRHAERWMASDVYQKFTDAISTVTAVFGVFLILFADEILEIYTGGKGALQAPMTGILIVSSWLNSAVWMAFSNPLFQKKKTKFVLFITLLSIAICTPLAFILVSKFGSLGASITLLINGILMWVIAAEVLRRTKFCKLNSTRISIIFINLFLISLFSDFCKFERWSELQEVIMKSAIFLIVMIISIFSIWRPTVRVLKIIESENPR